MEIEFKKFGKSGDFRIKLKDLTIIWGPNNSGKTFISYSIYGMLKDIALFREFDCLTKLYNDIVQNGSTFIHSEILINDLKKN